MIKVAQVSGSLTKASLPRKILLALALGYLLSCIFLWVVNLYHNYSNTDGFWLPNGRMAGADFLAFYTGAKFARSRPAELYDLIAQLEFQREFYLAGSGREPEGALVFVYPPQVAFILQPLAKLSLHTAFLVFFTLGSAVVWLSTQILSSGLGLKGSRALLVLVGVFSFTPLTFECLAGGQSGWIGFSVIAMTYISLQRKKQMLAGIVLSLGAYKPPLFALLWPVLFFSQSGRFRMGFILGGSAQLLLALYLVGVSGLSHYLGVAVNYRYGMEAAPGIALPPARGIGLYAFLTQNFGAETGLGALLVILVFLASWLIARISREGMTTNNFILSGAFSLFLSPQFLIYDLSIALPLVLLSLTKAGPNAVVSSALLYLEWIVRSGLPVEKGALVSMMAYSVWLISMVSGGEKRS